MPRANKKDLELAKAIVQKNAARVSQLIAKGANVNSKHEHRGGNYQDVTPLMLATELGSPEIVKLLLTAGAELEARNRAIMEDDTAGHCDTALNYAIRRGNQQIVTMLLEAGANVNGGGAASDSPLIEAMEKDDLKLAKLLLAKGANVDRRSEHNTPLHRAVSAGKFRFVKLLVDHEADIEATDVTGDTPLMLSANEPRKQICRLLIESGANVNARDKSNGWTALMWAVRNSSFDPAKLLLEHGAQVATKNRQRQTALSIAEILLRPWREEPEEIAEQEAVLLRTGESVADFRNQYRRLEKIESLLKKASSLRQAQKARPAK